MWHILDSYSLTLSAKRGLKAFLIWVYSSLVSLPSLPPECFPCFWPCCCSLSLTSELSFWAVIRINMQASVMRVTSNNRSSAWNQNCMSIYMYFRKITKVGQVLTFIHQCGRMTMSAYNSGTRSQEIKFITQLTIDNVWGYHKLTMMIYYHFCQSLILFNE